MCKPFRSQTSEEKEHWIQGSASENSRVKQKSPCKSCQLSSASPWTVTCTEIFDCFSGGDPFSHVTPWDFVPENRRNDIACTACLGSESLLGDCCGFNLLFRHSRAGESSIARLWASICRNPGTQLSDDKQTMFSTKHFNRPVLKGFYRVLIQQTQVIY